MQPDSIPRGGQNTDKKDGHNIASRQPGSIPRGGQNTEIIRVTRTEKMKLTDKD